MAVTLDASQIEMLRQFVRGVTHWQEGSVDRHTAMQILGMIHAPCPECNDTGSRDSGGTMPWGEPAMLPCDHRILPYKDSTPELHVGDSSFEDWFQQQPFATQSGAKQIARDSYAAGMGDPLVVGADKVRRNGPELTPEWCPRCNGTGEETHQEGRGPDVYEVPGLCTHCDGNGTLKAAYEGVLKLRQLTEKRYLKLCAQVYHQPDRDREADRRRFTDPDFNRWLDDSITENGEFCVWHQLGSTVDAYAGWTARQYHVLNPTHADLKPEDLVIETVPIRRSNWTRAVNAGVKITHTGLNVSITCCHERSVFANKIMAYNAIVGLADYVERGRSLHMRI